MLEKRKNELSTISRVGPELWAMDVMVLGPLFLGAHIFLYT
jgi:hypothetical protein